MSSYKTIESNSEGIYKDKGSKFLSFAIPINSLDESKQILQKFKKEHWNARHICYAYVFGQNRSEFRSFDDGEPSNTAGKPILGQINSFNLTNIIIIVVRYFGGVLLGTSGLITAYKEASLDAIKNATIIEKSIQHTILLRFSYVNLNETMKIIKEYKIEIINQTLDNECSLTIIIEKAYYQKIISLFQKIENLEIIAS
jgi:uncharacterized YigZ family protein